jgi:VWFA-related protein
MTLITRVGTLLCIALLATASSPAAPTAPENPPVFSSEVSLVLLPVFVADGHGRAMRGLSAGDFELYEDGKRAELVSFRYVDTTSADEQDAIREASAARRRFLLLFDKSFTEPGGLHRAQKAAAQFVRSGLADSDLAAVATFDVDRGIRIVANFTEDRALLAHAVATLGATNITRISDPLGLAADLSVTDLTLPGLQESTQNISEPNLSNVLSVLARRMRAAEQEQYRRHIQHLIGSLEELASGLRGVQGRKQILFFSAGFDAKVLIGETGSEQRSAAASIAEGRLWEVDGNTRYGDTSLRQSLAAMTRNLSTSDAVVHSIDVTGLGIDRSLTRTVAQVDSQRDTSGRESLNFLAAETGGRFFKDATDLGPVLKEMLEMTSRYYILGFQPRGSKAAGAFHKIKVKVARKGARLSHREGYYEKTPVLRQTPLQRQFEAAQLVLTGEGANDLPFATLCLPFPAPGDRQTLGLVLQVPRGSVRWTAGQTTSLEVYGYAVAEDGTVHDHLAQLARLDPARADPGGAAHGLSLFGTLAVQPGKYTVRLMVQEVETGKSGMQMIDVTVPPYDPKLGVLLPPVLMDEPGQWVGLDMTKGKADRPAFPFQLGDKPFVPRASFVTRAGMPETLVLLAYEPSQPGDPAAALQIRSSLRDRDGQLVPAGLIRIEKVHRSEPGRRTYVLGYTPDTLAIGDYTLRIGIGESGSQLEAYSLLRVRAGS